MALGRYLIIFWLVSSIGAHFIVLSITNPPEGLPAMQNNTNFENLRNSSINTIQSFNVFDNWGSCVSSFGASDIIQNIMPNNWGTLLNKVKQNCNILAGILILSLVFGVVLGALFLTFTMITSIVSKFFAIGTLNNPIGFPNPYLIFAVPTFLALTWITPWDLFAQIPEPYSFLILPLIFTLWIIALIDFYKGQEL